MIYRRILSAMALALALGGCGMFSDEDETKNWSAQKFYTEAKAALNEGDYDQAVKYYELLEARYPFGRYALQSQLDVAYAHYKNAEPESALAAADRFIKLNPQNPHVDYAYYLKGIVNYNRKIGLLDRFIPTDQSQRDPGAARDSFEDFSELLRLHPNSQYAEDARLRMLYLRDNLAKNEVHVARYYMRRGAYLAAANRAKYVLENFSHSTVAEDALEIMVDAYGRLGMESLQADARRVLELNRAKQTFAEDTKVDEKKTWGEQVWEYLELDQE